MPAAALDDRFPWTLFADLLPEPTDRFTAEQIPCSATAFAFWLLRHPELGLTVAAYRTATGYPLRLLAETGYISTHEPAAWWPDIPALLTAPALDYTLIAGLLDLLAVTDPARADGETLLLALSNPARAARIASARQPESKLTS